MHPTSRLSPASRAGLSAIELVAVLAVIAILASLGTPALLSAMSAGRLNEAAEAIRTAHQVARSHARRVHTGSGFYGVTIASEADGTAYVAVTYGATADPSTILLSDGRPVYRKQLGRRVRMWDGAAPLSGSRGWFCQHRSGLPIAIADPTAPPASILGLRVRGERGRNEVAVAVYEVGIVATESL